uniref:Uncharacterized protein n=1 Tax=Tanacetum cinerariifolium TaxID=118510 RepID=A0A6L2LTX9_TANCI|nr:hypothetical protein [Tanacetum cinerariifolium]
MQKYTRFDAQSFQDAMICNMDSIGNYMLEIILHQQRTPHLMKQNKLMQTQEDHSNPTQALNINSLKVDLVVIQNTCSEKEDTNSEIASSKSVKESSLDSATKDVHAIQYKITMLLNVDRLQKQTDKDEFQEDGSMTAFWVVNNQFQKFINSQFTLKYDSQMTDKYFVEYTGIKVKHFIDKLLQYMGNVKKSIAERTRHQRQYDRRVNKRHIQTQESKIDTGKAVDTGLLVTESSGTESEVQDVSLKILSRTRKPIYDEEPMAEVHMTVEINIFATGQQYIEQPEFNNEGEVDQNTKQWKLILQPNINQSVVRQPTAFKSERPRTSKPRFASQVDVNNDLSKPVTTHYLPKERESVVVKSHHVIASSESRNRSKNMPRFSSNDMVHNHDLEEAKKRTQKRDRNSRPSVMPSTRSQSTANDCKPKPRINNQNFRNWPTSKSSCVTTKTVPIAKHPRNSMNFSDSKHFVCSTCQKCIFNANHDSCVTKFLKEVNSRAKFPSNKTMNRNKPIEQTSFAKKPER